MKNIFKRFILLASTFLFSVLLMSPVTAFAESDDTDGSEIQVVQPEQLEIQLGTAWACVEFQLRTDSGVYPDPIPVSQDGVLRLEIGGSTRYILSCLSLEASAPISESGEMSDPTETDGFITGTEATEDADPVVSADAPAEAAASEDTPEPEIRTVAGIPVRHLVFFGLGLFICVIVLAVLRISAINRADDADFDEYDED